MIRYNFQEFCDTLEINFHETSFWESFKHIPLLKDEIRMTDAWLAGGSLLRLLTNENINAGDFDIYFPYLVAMQNYKNDVMACHFTFLEEDGYISTWSKGDVKVQVIKKMYPKMDYVLNSFDYTICQLLYNGEDI